MMLTQAFFNMPSLSKNEQIILNQYLESYPENLNLNQILVLLKNQYNGNIHVRRYYRNRPIEQLLNDIVEQIENLNAVSPNNKDTSIVGQNVNGIKYGRRI